MTDNITVFKHNSIRIDAENGPIYVDPFEMDEAPHDAAFILITHDHYDHFSVKDIEKVACNNTVLVVPRKMVEKAREVEALVAKIETVKPEISKNITLEAAEGVEALFTHETAGNIAGIPNGVTFKNL